MSDTPSAWLSSARAGLRFVYLVLGDATSPARVSAQVEEVTVVHARYTRGAAGVRLWWPAASHYDYTGSAGGFGGAETVFWRRATSSTPHVSTDNRGNGSALNKMMTNPLPGMRGPPGTCGLHEANCDEGTGGVVPQLGQ